MNLGADGFASSRLGLPDSSPTKTLIPLVSNLPHFSTTQTIVDDVVMSRQSYGHDKVVMSLRLKLVETRDGHYQRYSTQHYAAHGHHVTSTLAV
jgi:hypothetical protein